MGRVGPSAQAADRQQTLAGRLRVGAAGDCPLPGADGLELEGLTIHPLAEKSGRPAAT